MAKSKADLSVQAILNIRNGLIPDIIIPTEKTARIIANTAYLVDNLDPDFLIHYLMTYADVFNVHILNFIQEEDPRTKLGRLQRFLQWIVCTGDKAYEAFCEVASDNGYAFISNTLQDTKPTKIEEILTKLIAQSPIRFRNQDITPYDVFVAQSLIQIYSDKATFQPTSEFQMAINILETNKILVIFGPAKCGRSALGRALVRHFQGQGYAPLVPRNDGEWRKYIGVNGQRQAVLLDDMFGVIRLRKGKYRKWTQNIPTMDVFGRNSQCLTVFTIRLNVLQKMNKDCENFCSIFGNVGFLFLDNPREIKFFNSFQDVRDHIYLNDPSIKGVTNLYTECLAGETKKVKMLLACGADVEAVDESGRTPLHAACRSGYTHIVRCLLDKNANTEVETASGKTPLFLACKNGHCGVVKILLEKKYVHVNNNGPNIDAKNHSGQTPLFIACKNGHLGVVKTLVDHGANVCETDENLWTPLHAASHKGLIKIVRYLLSKGADTELETNSGQTALYLALEKGHTDVVHTLLDNSEKSTKPTIGNLIKPVKAEVTKTNGSPLSTEQNAKK